MAHNEQGFAIWWHFVFCQLKLLLKFNSITIDQRFYFCHHIAKPMLAAFHAVVGVIV
jgi:hypothetical protein